MIRDSASLSAPASSPTLARKVSQAGAVGCQVLNYCPCTVDNRGMHCTGCSGREGRQSIHAARTGQSFRGIIWSSPCQLQNDQNCLVFLAACPCPMPSTHTAFAGCGWIIGKIIMLTGQRVVSMQVAMWPRLMPKQYVHTCTCMYSQWAAGTSLKIACCSWTACW